MLKKIVLDWLLPAVAIGVVVVAGIFMGESLGLLGRFDSAQRDNEQVRTVDTPQYRALDSAYREQEKKLNFWQGYVEGLEMYYDKLESQKQGVKTEGKKKEQEYHAKPENEKETEFWKKYKEMFKNN